MLATAVHYISLAKSGAIKDRAYTKTVAEAFNVDRTTVQTWWRDRRRISADISAPRPEDIVTMLRVAGARYHFNRTGEKAGASQR